MESIIFLVALGFVIGVPVVAVVALAKARRNTRRLDETRAEAARLSHRTATLEQQLSELRAELDGTRAVDQAAPEAVERIRPAEPHPAAEVPADFDEPSGQEPSEPPAEFVDPPAQEPAEPPIQEPPGPPKRSLEETLASRWLVWLGAVAIALAGAFLVKYAVDRSWLGPAVRDSLGVLLGVLLIVGGEWLRRRPMQRAIAAVQPNYVPPALSASGLFVAFASIFAAYAMHDLLSPLVAFTALAAVALVAVGLSLLQGPFVALIGLLGGYLTPALVSTNQPWAWGLFPYLLVITIAGLAVVRYQAWWWLAVATLAGAGVWPVLWFVVAWTPADAIPVGGYLVALAAAFLLVRHGLARPSRPAGWWAEMRALTLPEEIAWAGASAAAILMFMMVRNAAYSTSSLVLLGVLACLFLVIGRREAVFDGLAVAAALLVVALMASWHQPAMITYPEPVYTMAARAYGRIPGPIVPPELLPFLSTETLFGGLFAIGGFVALWGAKRPAIWAGVSAGTAVLLLVVAYARIVDFGLDFRWAAVALALAIAGLLPAAKLAPHRANYDLAVALGFYAAAVVAFISLAAAMTLERAWLTVALAIELPALAWIGAQLPVKPIRVLAAIVASVVLVRLVVNYNVLDYPLGAQPLFSWVLYGYGIPAIMFFWSARVFRRQASDQLIALLEAGGLAFLVLLVFWQIRVFVGGALDHPRYGLLEQSLQSIAWLTIAYVLAVHNRLRPHVVSLWGGRILLAIALAQVVVVQLLVDNPIWTGMPVGAYPVVNLLFLAYAVPALFAFGFARERELLVLPYLVKVVGGLGFVLFFAYLTLEVRRAFQGSVLQPSHQSDGEYYAYSAAWLAYAGVLLGLGIYRKLAVLRYASLAVLMLTVLKVFISDMSDLTGLYRVASFLVLGLCLVGIGYLYQRFVFPPRPPPTADPP